VLQNPAVVLTEWLEKMQETKKQNYKTYPLFPTGSRNTDNKLPNLALFSA
jgi:hypothetical protein